jgi:predicted DsbA family dithiol-disulfide isomerase
MVEIGAQHGIAFRYDLIERTPSTLASHVMIADARRAGGLAMQGRTVEALFAAYFYKGRDVGRPDVLRAIASDVGFDHGPSVNAELWELVEQEDLAARQSGVSGVPTFLLDGHFLFSGAQPPEVIVSALRSAVAALDAGNASGDLL